MKQKIAFVITNLAGGGAERQISNITINLPDNYKTFIILQRKKEIVYPYKGTLIGLEYSSKYKNPNKILKCFILYKKIQLLKQFKKKYCFDTVVSFLDMPNLLNLFSKSTEKTIISMRSNYSAKLKRLSDGKRFRSKLLMRLFYNKADTIVALTKGVKHDLVQNFGILSKKIKVIYPFFDVDNIRKMVKEDIEKQYLQFFNNPIIITVGRLSWPKGQYHLIRAFKKVKDFLPNVKLVIIGQGELEMNLKELVKDLGLNDDVLFLGFQTNPFKYLSKSKVFVFPSLFEGFGNALGEAMACGLPVIASDCRFGPREILAPDTDFKIQSKDIEFVKHGVLVPVCDGIFHGAKKPLTKEEEFLSQSILRIVKNKELAYQYSKASQKRIEDFRIKNILGQWIDILQ